MKHISTLSVMLGAGLLLANQGLAQTAQVTPIAQQPKGQDPSVVIPDSSLARPEDTGKAAHTNTRFIPPQLLGARPEAVNPAAGPPFSGYGYETPGSLACLYGLVGITAGCNPNSATTVSAKGSRAIAIVDAYYYATALTDLQKFSTQFGLPAPTLTVLYATSAGSCAGPKPPFNAGWEGEQALDLQMAHAMAPKATLYLVEAQSNSNADLLGAVKCANSKLTAAGGGELSMSWGGSEFSTEASYDATYFSTPNVVYFASTGDSPGVEWPSISANVVAAGGTSISRGSNFNFSHYSTWSEGGGGASLYVARPAYQNSISGIVGTKRGEPDISADANPNTGVWVYDSNPTTGIGWYIFGGTSVSSPLLAGVVNALGTFRANTSAELTALYNAKAASQTLQFAIPTTGYCGPYAGYSVVPDWNFCVGVGTVQGPATTPLILQ